jgi:2-dehydro-3-deoxygluconokinase
MNSTAVAAIGECMIELRHTDERHLVLAYAGDTLNTAVYLKRSLGEAGTVHYVTAVGDDPYSKQMMAGWHAEGIDTSDVVTVKGLNCGLYLIQVSAAGERSFTYYRSQSAARNLYDTAIPPRDLDHFGIIFLSGITLSILSDAGRERLWAALAQARSAGAQVAFDTNFRPIGWPSADFARTTVERTLQLTDIALPTFDDEQALWADRDPQACAARLRSHGVGEIVIKVGADGALVAADRGLQHVPARPVEKIVDTTAAGDSFNGAYLASRIRGADPIAAAEAGNELAAVVIGHGGAIIAASGRP